MPKLESELAITEMTLEELDPRIRNAARNKVIVGLFRRRYEYSDEIPPEVRISNTEDGPFIKARKAWFTELSCYFQNAITLGLIKKIGDIVKVDETIEELESPDFWGTYHPLVTESDIQKGNASIDYVISIIPPELIKEALKPGIQFRLNIPWRFS